MKKIVINKSNRFVITAAVIVIAILFILLSMPTTKPLSPLPTSKKFDKFGISEIYPTKPVGREWFINMDNPASDGIFDPQSNISRQTDGSWRIGGKQTGVSLMMK